MTVTDSVRSAPPAGWYPDPQGLPQQRWWSGSQWTHDTQPNDAAPATAAPSTYDQSFLTAQTQQSAQQSGQRFPQSAPDAGASTLTPQQFGAQQPAASAPAAPAASVSNDTGSLTRRQLREMGATGQVPVVDATPAAPQQLAPQQPAAQQFSAQQPAAPQQLAPQQPAAQQFSAQQPAAAAQPQVSAQHALPSPPVSASDLFPERYGAAAPSQSAFGAPQTAPQQPSASPFGGAPAQQAPQQAPQQFAPQQAQPQQPAAQPWGQQYTPQQPAAQPFGQQYTPQQPAAYGAPQFAPAPAPQQQMPQQPAVQQFAPQQAMPQQFAPQQSPFGQQYAPQQQQIALPAAPSAAGASAPIQAADAPAVWPYQQDASTGQQPVQAQRGRKLAQTSTVYTFAGWLLAITPLIAAGGIAAAYLGLGTTYSMMIEGAVLGVVLLLGVALAFADGRQLKASGHDSVAGPAWALLTPLVYLAIRSFRVRENTGRMGVLAIVWIVFAAAVGAGAYFLIDATTLSGILMPKG